MGCTIVVGGQYGSEGKGKVVALHAARFREPWVVRCGGPNSGHTVDIRGRKLALRQVPAGATRDDALLLLSAGCIIDEELLAQEVDELDLTCERIVVDPRAILVMPSDRALEQDAVQRIASTASGTGAALIRRMTRRGDAALAAESEILRGRVRVEPVAPLIHERLEQGGEVIVEGTQGFGLSLLHGPHYPYVTSRDTTASGFAMEVGLSPRHIDSVILVIRTFPIRVGGNSGPFKDEISWEEVQRLSQAPAAMPEYTSVTNRLRRVARFDLDFVRIACQYNRPTSLAVMGLDRLDYANNRVIRFADMSTSAQEFLRVLERETGIPVEWVGTGFATSEAFRLPHGAPNV